ncbi:MAG: DinB family protein [Chloroflexi bacterium]|nr:DinB family protein [Chloroflexota bacterium]
MNSDETVRQQVRFLLEGGGAHMSLDQAVADFPVDHINTRPANVSYSFWHLLEHIRIAQWDILDFCRNADYQHMQWPDAYWPAPDTVADAQQWQATVDGIRHDLAEMVALVAYPNTDLYMDLPHAPGYNILREALLIADHNAYHIGEFAILRQVLGIWPGV